VRVRRSARGAALQPDGHENLVTALLAGDVLQRFGLNPKDERYTMEPEKQLALDFMKLERFTLDSAGCPESHLAPRWFGLQLDGSFIDGLQRAWRGDVFCNPPFSTWDAWVIKAWSEWERGRVRSITMLLPDDKRGQPTWQQWVRHRRDRRGSPLRTEDLPGRSRFSGPGLEGRPICTADGRPGSPFFGCVLLGWHRRFLRGFA
jgi:DNA N-6-adenine-methyltransferase (Dam)